MRKYIRDEGSEGSLRKKRKSIHQMPSKTFRIRNGLLTKTLCLRIDAVGTTLEKGKEEVKIEGMMVIEEMTGITEAG